MIILLLLRAIYFLKTHQNMKKIALITMLLALFLSNGIAQNLQLHFDPRHALYGDSFSRNYLTATFEIFKPDSWGSTFMFVDFDFNQSKGNMGLAYAELARDIRFGKCPIQAHIEYNGGLVLGANYSGFTISSAYLGGISYSKEIAGFNLGTYLAYKYHAFEKGSHDIQWTGTWSKNFCKDKLTFSGFIDIWTENKYRMNTSFISGKHVVILTEPQLWYNPTKHLSIGTEVEISNNFVSGASQAFIIPTLGLKWTL